MCASLFGFVGCHRAPTGRGVIGCSKGRSKTIYLALLSLPLLTGTETNLAQARTKTLLSTTPTISRTKRKLHPHFQKMSKYKHAIYPSHRFWKAEEEVEESRRSSPMYAKCGKCSQTISANGYRFSHPSDVAQNRVTRDSGRMEWMVQQLPREMGKG